MIVPTVLLDAWATALGRACWQSSLVVLAVWLICWLIPTMPAQCQCWLWRLAVLKFVLALLCPSLLDLPLLPTSPAAAVDPQVILALDVPVIPADQVACGRSPMDAFPWLNATLFSAWVIGVGWSVVWLLVAWHGTRRLRKESKSTSCSPIIEQLNAQTSLFGLRSSPELVETVGEGSPMLVGILRPAIVIPGETLRRLNFSEQIIVLGHELAHVRRGDLLWSLIVALVRAVFFFHPLVWLSQRRLNLAQEIAADELAITRQQHDPVSYGKLVVSVVGKLGPGRLIPTMSMGTAGPVESLARRLVAMTHYGRVPRRVVVGSGVLLAGMVLVGLVPWRLVAGEPNALSTATADNSEHHVAPNLNVCDSLGDGNRLKSHEDESLDHILRQMWLRASKHRGESKPLPHPISLPREAEKDNKSKPLPAPPSPIRLVEAEPQDGETQQRLAALKVSERQKDKPETVLANPNLTFLVGQSCCMVTQAVAAGNKIRYFGIMIRSLPNKKPIENVVEGRDDRSFRESRSRCACGPEYDHC